MYPCNSAVIFLLSLSLYIYSFPCLLNPTLDGIAVNSHRNRTWSLLNSPYFPSLTSWKVLLIWRGMGWERYPSCIMVFSLSGEIKKKCVSLCEKYAGRLDRYVAARGHWPQRPRAGMTLAGRALPALGIPVRGGGGIWHRPIAMVDGNNPFGHYRVSLKVTNSPEAWPSIAIVIIFALSRMMAALPEPCLSFRLTATWSRACRPSTSSWEAATSPSRARTTSSG